MPCKNLPPFILQKYLVGIPVGIYAVATPVEFFTNASCEADQDPDNGSTIEKTTLQFSTTQNLPYGIPLAFVVKDVNDRAYVIGFREAPFPLITTNTSITDDKNIYVVKVQFNARKSLVPCSY